MDVSHLLHNLGIEDTVNHLPYNRGGIIPADDSNPGGKTGWAGQSFEADAASARQLLQHEQDKLSNSVSYNILVDGSGSNVATNGHRARSRSGQGRRDATSKKGYRHVFLERVNHVTFICPLAHTSKIYMPAVMYYLLFRVRLTSPGRVCCSAQRGTVYICFDPVLSLAIMHDDCTPCTPCTLSVAAGCSPCWLLSAKLRECAVGSRRLWRHVTAVGSGQGGVGGNMVMSEPTVEDLVEAVRRLQPDASVVPAVAQG